MKELRELFDKIAAHIGLVGPDSKQIAKTFFDQVYAIFVENTLRTRLPEEVFKNRIQEYQSYIKEGKHGLVNNDVKYYMGKDSSKLFGEAFLKHLKFFVHGLKEKGEITEQQLHEVGELLKTHIKNSKVVSQMNAHNGNPLEHLAGTQPNVAQMPAQAPMMQQPAPVQQPVVSMTQQPIVNQMQSQPEPVMGMPTPSFAPAPDLSARSSMGEA